MTQNQEKDSATSNDRINKMAPTTTLQDDSKTNQMTSMAFLQDMVND